MTQPPLGLTLPARIVSVQDGDTLTVDVTVRANVRLCGNGKRQCWAKELKETGGIEAKDNLTKYAAGQCGRIHLPMDRANNLADLFTLGRVLGDIWLDGTDESLSEMQVRMGHASTKKGGKLGE